MCWGLRNWWIGLRNLRLRRNSWKFWLCFIIIGMDELKVRSVMAWYKLEASRIWKKRVLSDCWNFSVFWVLEVVSEKVKEFFQRRSVLQWIYQLRNEGWDLSTKMQLSVAGAKVGFDVIFQKLNKFRSDVFLSKLEKMSINFKRMASWLRNQKEVLSNCFNFGKWYRVWMFSRKFCFVFCSSL